jgi:fermentation-respiration switch protein FrsA (DUF1100 family)
MLRWFEHSQVYHPDRFVTATGAELGRPFEDVYFQTPDGVRLNGWFFPADPNSARAQIVVLFCHGNGGNIGHRLAMCKALLSTGIGVLLFDYRGYGRSSGYPSEEGTYCDAETAYRWLLNKGFIGGNVILYGESLGGGVASELATRLNSAGLVLQSTFTSIADIGADLFPWLPVRRLAAIKYETLSRLRRVRVPVLVMHSRGDRLVRFPHAERNFSAANDPKLFCELEGEHNEPLTNRLRFVADFNKFLELIAQTRKETAATR